MKKILLILGVLLTLANNASSSGASQPIPPESDNIISSPPKKGKKEPQVLDRMFAKNTPSDSGEWFWANDKPLLPSENTKAPKSLYHQNPQEKFSVSRNLFRILQKSILLTRDLKKISHQGFLLCTLCQRLNPKGKNQKKDCWE